MSARPFMDPAWEAIDPDQVELKLTDDKFMELCQLLAYWPESLGCPEVHVRSDGSVQLNHYPASKGDRHRYFSLSVANSKPLRFMEFGWDPGFNIISPKIFDHPSIDEVIDRLHTVWTHSDIPYDRSQPMT